MKSAARMNWHLCVAVIVGASTLGGCIKLDARPHPPLPAYADLVARYNRNLERVERLSSIATVEMRWREEGRNRFEQGDGILAVVPPDHLSMTVGKLGHGFRAGCDETQYWLFDLRDDQKVLRFGRQDRARRVSAGVLPVAPHTLIRLLGLVKIDPKRVPSKCPVEWFQDHYLIEPPGTRTRMLLDTRHARPVRIDLIDARGYSRFKATLSEFKHVKIEGVSQGHWPSVATRVAITRIGTDDHATLFLSDPIGDKDAVDPVWFDLDRLREALAPDIVIDMDEKPRTPAE